MRARSVALDGSSLLINRCSRVPPLPVHSGIRYDFALMACSSSRLYVMPAAQTPSHREADRQRWLTKAKSMPACQPGCINEGNCQAPVSPGPTAQGWLASHSLNAAMRAEPTTRVLQSHPCLNKPLN